MARRDYASKPNRSAGASKPSATRSPRSPASPPKSQPAGLVAAALLATALLAGLVWYLSSIMGPGEPPLSAQPETEQPASKPATTQALQQSTAVRAPGESLPLDETTLEQDERFGFYDLLKDTQVETPEESAYTSTPKSAALDTPYLLQTGSFRQSADAEAMRARLTLAGLPNVRTNRSGDWYRVTTGPFRTYNELKTATNKLEKLNIHPVKRKAN